MIKTPINLQDLRRKIYTKAKTDRVKRPPKALPTG
jgi:hypothetical protein